MNVVANLHEVQQQIVEFAQLYGRDPNSIKLIAVSKGRTLEEMLPLYYAGQHLFGESRQQEADSKIAIAPSDIKWHFIGTLQKNKVRKVIGKFSLIHSVDSVELAEKISECSLEMGVVSKILLQVNTSGELTKHGLDSESWRRSIDNLLTLPGIVIEGLMTIAPLNSDEVCARHCFSQLRLFRDSLKFSLPYLSMGMSHDYRWAIAEGANLVRIGSAIFSKS
jgi:pyridoxal phosphate enzyme (YggS family)